MKLALYQPEIPQNVGTMIRLGSCLGVGIDIIDPCGFVWDDTRLKRAGMDYIDLATVTRHSCWDEFRHQASSPPNPSRIILLDTKATLDYWDFSFHCSDILLVGQESCGVSDVVFDQCQYQVKIPMVSNRRSLNVAVAASVVLGEAIRQTRFNNN
ncbi:MAG: tRNA (cytidine(34)-2'-O)-methyltransferase [Alphaproteobacteria bacterium]|nr:tRNA (cytidine(34)-2'-O)-methyltransferase [Alphaproteobacteria bacterium]